MNGEVKVFVKIQTQIEGGSGGGGRTGRGWGAVWM